MKTILRKLFRDFRLAKMKLLLLLIAASFSGWGISSVVYSYLLTERDFEVNFEQTKPADITVTVDQYSEAVLNAFLADPNVVDIERREVINARIKNNQDAWMPLILWAVEDLDSMRYDRIKVLDDDAYGPDNILIEKNAWFYLNEGQTQIDLLFKDEEDVVSLDVAGSAHDARQAPARMEGIVYAYATSIEKISPWLDAGRRRLLIETNVSDDKEKLEAVMERLETIAQQAGAEVIGGNIPEPGEHIHQGIVDGIAFLQESGGAILSIMGIILLSLILLTWIYPQISDIGVMKSIGASTKHLFLSYSIALGCIVLVGLMIGLPIGYTTATLYNRAIAFFQNFEVVTELLPISNHIFVLLIGMTIPLLFGIIPLAKATETTVNDAINKTFYIPHRGIFHLSQRLISNSRLKYGINNLFRHTQRTSLTALLLAVGLALYFTASNMEHSIREDLAVFDKSSAYEVITILPEEMEKEQVRFLDELEIVEEVVPINSSRVTYIPPNSGSPEFSIARTFATKIQIDPEFVVRGEIDKSCSDCLYVCGEEMKNAFEGVELGSPIELTKTSGEKRTYTFSGVVNDIVVLGSPFFLFDDSITQSFDLLAFRLTPGLERAEILGASNAIDDAFIDNGINLRRLMSVKRRLAGILGHLDPTFLIIKVMGIFTIILGMSGLIIVLNLTIQERTREIGIMKSIGSPFRKISGMFNQEFLLISVLAIITGVLLAMPVAKAMIHVVAETVIRHPVPFKNDFLTIGITVVVVLTLQLVLISIYNRFKIGKNARELLDHNF